MGSWSSRAAAAELELWLGELCPSDQIPQGRKERMGGLPPRKQLWNEDEIQCLLFLPETIGNAVHCIIVFAVVIGKAQIGCGENMVLETLGGEKLQ